MCSERPPRSFFFKHEKETFYVLVPICISTYDYVDQNLLHKIYLYFTYLFNLYNINLGKIQTTLISYKCRYFLKLP